MESAMDLMLKKLPRRCTDLLARVYMHFLAVSVVYTKQADIFVMAFIDGLHEKELPIGRLHVGFPYDIEE